MGDEYRWGSAVESTSRIYKRLVEIDIRNQIWLCYITDPIFKTSVDAIVGFSVGNRANVRFMKRDGTLATPDPDGEFASWFDVNWFPMMQRCARNLIVYGVFCVQLGRRSLGRMEDYALPASPVEINPSDVDIMGKYDHEVPNMGMFKMTKTVVSTKFYRKSGRYALFSHDCITEDVYSCPGVAALDSCLARKAAKSAVLRAARASVTRPLIIGRPRGDPSAIGGGVVGSGISSTALTSMTTQQACSIGYTPDDVNSAIDDFAKIQEVSMPMDSGLPAGMHDTYVRGSTKSRSVAAILPDGATLEDPPAPRLPPYLVENQARFDKETMYALGLNPFVFQQTSRGSSSSGATRRVRIQTDISDTIALKVRTLVSNLFGALVLDSLYGVSGKRPDDADIIRVQFDYNIMPNSDFVEHLVERGIISPDKYAVYAAEVHGVPRDLVSIEEDETAVMDTLAVSKPEE
jgi:hypothetical protein